MACFLSVSSSVLTHCWWKYSYQDVYSTPRTEHTSNLSLYHVCLLPSSLTLSRNLPLIPPRLACHTQHLRSTSCQMYPCFSNHPIPKTWSGLMHNFSSFHSFGRQLNHSGSSFKIDLLYIPSFHYLSWLKINSSISDFILSTLHYI